MCICNRTSIHYTLTDTNQYICVYIMRCIHTVILVYTILLHILINLCYILYTRMSAIDYAEDKGYYATAAIIASIPMYTSLHRACKEGDYNTVSALIRQGCDVNIREKHSINIVVSTSNNTTSQINSPNSNNTDNSTDYTPLMLASAYGKTNIVHLLLTYKHAIPIEIDAQDSTGRTALMLAAGIGCLDVTELLLSAGADREKCDMHNNNSTYYAKLHSTATYMTFLGQKIFR